MKLEMQKEKKRDIKNHLKEKEASLPILVPMQKIEEDLPEKLPEKPIIGDLIACQICKDEIMDDHRMCPKCLQIWCYECIKPWLRLKNYSCPNCRKKMKAKQLKKSPLFEKLKEYIKTNQKDDVVFIEETPKASFCAIHNETDNFFCNECKVLCCSRCALLDEKHRGHQFISLEEIYDTRKKCIEDLKNELQKFNGELSNLCDESNSHNTQSQINLKASKEQFSKLVQSWEDEFVKEFENQYAAQVARKCDIEEVLDETKCQTSNVISLLDFPHQSKLVKNFNKVVDECKEVLAKKENIKISRVIDGEEIENQFVPQYIAKECTVSGINDSTPCDTIIYADEFELNKDKFKLGTKIIKNKKSKTVEISLRINKANSREKKYESKLFIIDNNNQENFLGEFNIELEAQPPTTNMILHSINMNSNFDKLSVEDDQLVFLLKIRPKSYQQTAIDLQDYIDSLKQNE